MMGYRVLGVYIICALVCLIVNVDVQARQLTIDERVETQRSIERVLWSHRIWPAENPGSKPSFESVMSEGALADRVTAYLQKSKALETSARPITPRQMQSEMDRMARSTRRPDVLGELFEALNDDPFMIAECLARPIL